MRRRRANPQSGRSCIVTKHPDVSVFASEARIVAKVSRLADSLFVSADVVGNCTSRSCTYTHGTVPSAMFSAPVLSSTHCNAGRDEESVIMGNSAPKFDRNVVLGLRTWYFPAR